jgi:CP family cyanate transporter-like MFS transporter
VTTYLGLQSVQFYTVSAWLPTLLADSGVPVREGGLLLGLANVVGRGGACWRRPGRPDAHPAPADPGRGASLHVGLGGLLIAPAPARCVGRRVRAGAGRRVRPRADPDRAAQPTPLVAARLGGVAQCLGYLLAALGPLVSARCTT